jgi:hypothetical protein
VTVTPWHLALLACVASAGCSGAGSAKHADGGGAGDDAARDALGVYDGPVTDSACPNLPAAGSWQNISPPGSNYTSTYSGMNAVVVRPDNPAIVYAGADSNGMFKSTDCGATWALINTGENAAALSSGRPWSLVIDPVMPDVMYVVEGYGASGLWKSTNAGVDWKNVLTSNISSAFYSGGQMTSISLDPGDHTHIVVESHGNCASGNLCAAESSDSGATWTLIDMTAVGAWAENSAVAIVNRTTWLYCGYFSGLFRTADEGASWQAVPAMGALPSCNYYEPYLWQAPGGQDYLAAIAYTGPGLLVSAPNDTSSWTLIANSPQANVLMATEKNLILAKSSDGTYSMASQSDPSTWKTLAGPPVGAPDAGTDGNIGAEFMAYDGAHHVLYASTFTGGLWQTLMP